MSENFLENSFCWFNSALFKGENSVGYEENWLSENISHEELGEDCQQLGNFALHPLI
jgi:hypothetical protein